MASYEAKAVFDAMITFCEDCGHRNNRHLTKPYGELVPDFAQYSHWTCAAIGCGCDNPGSMVLSEFHPNVHDGRFLKR